jgi:hypothetical protein
MKAIELSDLRNLLHIISGELRETCVKNSLIITFEMSVNINVMSVINHIY